MIDPLRYGAVMSKPCRASESIDLAEKMSRRKGWEENIA